MPARYAKTDAASLAYLRRELLRPHYTAIEVGAGVTVAATVVGGTPHPHILAACRTPVLVTQTADLVTCNQTSSERRGQQGDFDSK